jgi:IMP dehydrogenase/GMP reductase
MEFSFGFESIAIKQKKNICKSRLDVNIESEIIRGLKVKVPLIAANMSTVVDYDFLELLMKNGAFGFFHRAKNYIDYLEDVKKFSQDYEYVPVSIGVGNSEYESAQGLIKMGANVVLIDVAHGYADSVIDLGRQLKKEYPHIKVVVGNTTNVNMIEEVNDFADAVKVGIAQGFACETKNTAGCTEKQFSAILKFKERSKYLGLPIIGDGGIREPADVVKSIAAGANSVMAGKIFAECLESAAETVLIDNKKKKLYAGMASEHVQKSWKGGLKPGTCAEGGIRYLDIKYTLSEMLEMYSGALKSGITYAGGNDIKSFQNSVEFIRLV